MKSTDLTQVSELLSQRATLKGQIAALDKPAEADVTVSFDVDDETVSYDDVDMQRAVASVVASELGRRLGKIESKLGALGVQITEEPEPVNDDIVVERPIFAPSFPAGAVLRLVSPIGPGKPYFEFDLPAFRRFGL